MIGCRMIKENIEIVRQKIKAACENTGRNPKDVTIVAVTKRVEPAKITEAVICGINNFGESYFQEAIDKIPTVKENVKWHFVGHLQKNKAARVVSFFDLIQSVDSFELLAKINAAAQPLNKLQEVLLQVNLAEEESKFGMGQEEVFNVLRRAEALASIRFKGLMLIPPLRICPGDNRIYFERLRLLSEKISKSKFKNWESKYLSMGMSDDYDIAVSEGANLVRIGTAIFGERE